MNTSKPSLFFCSNFAKGRAEDKDTSFKRGPWIHAMTIPDPTCKRKFPCSPLLCLLGVSPLLYQCCLSPWICLFKCKTEKESGAWGSPSTQPPPPEPKGTGRAARCPALGERRSPLSPVCTRPLPRPAPTPSSGAPGRRFSLNPHK